MKRVHAMPFGAVPDCREVRGFGCGRPAPSGSSWCARAPRSMPPACRCTPCRGGWYELDAVLGADRVDAPTGYAFRIDGGAAVPDPAAYTARAC